MTIPKNYLPNAISIGGQRCGSSTLHKILGDSNSVFWQGELDSLGKILATGGVGEVARIYVDGKDAIIRGEKTPTYSAMYRCEVEQIAKLLPDMKIIFTIRNPVDRCWSSLTRIWSYAYLEGQPDGPQTNKAILGFLDSGLTRRLTDYDRSLRIWLSYFPREQLHINTFDQLCEKPKQFYEEIFEFLGIKYDDSFNVDFSVRKNRTKVERSIDPYHRYFLACRWLPMVRRLKDQLPELPEICDWEEELLNIRDEGSKEWRRRILIERLKRDIVHQVAYRPFSCSRALCRARKMKKQVRRYHLHTS